MPAVHPDSLEVRASGMDTTGEGVFVLNSVERGDIICEYLGTLISVPLSMTKALWPPKVEDITPSGNFSFFFQTLDGRGWCIDANNSSGPGRKINHSKKDPNVKPVVFQDNGVPRLFFKAFRNIDGGEELRYDYGEEDIEALKCHTWLND